MTGRYKHPATSGVSIVSSISNISAISSISTISTIVATSVILTIFMISSNCLQGPPATDADKNETSATPQVPATTIQTDTMPPSTSQSSTPRQGQFNMSLVFKYETDDEVYGVGISEDGYITAGSWDDHVYMLNMSGDLLWKFKTDGSVSDVAISGDRIAATSYRIKRGKVYYLKSGKEEWVKNIPYLLKGVDISKEGNVVTGSDDGKIRFFNSTGEEQWEFQTGESAWGVWDVAISPDGNYVAAAGDDRNVYLLSSTGELLWKRHTGRKSFLYGIAVSRNARYIAAVSQDKKVYLFDRNGTRLWTRQTGFLNYGVAISPDNRYIAAGSWDKNIYVYDTGGRQVLKYNIGDDVNRIAFTKNYLAAGSGDRNIYLFEWNS